MADAIDSNALEQMLTLRRHWLPSCDDSEQSLARALWLQTLHLRNLETVTANGVNRALSGKGD